MKEELGANSMASQNVPEMGKKTANQARHPVVHTTNLHSGGRKAGERE